MAPVRKSRSGNAATQAVSNGGTPGQQRSISSFFSSKASASLSPTPAGVATKKKPVLCIGIPVCASESSQDVGSMDLPPVKKRRVESKVTSPSTVNKNESIDYIATPSRCETALISRSSNSVGQKNGLSYSVIGQDLSNPRSLVGKSLKVYWPLDDAWYEGYVKAYNASAGLHVVHYNDDGVEEALILENEKVEWMDDAPGGDKVKPRKGGRRRLIKRSSTNAPLKSFESPLVSEMQASDHLAVEPEAVEPAIEASSCTKARRQQRTGRKIVYAEDFDDSSDNVDGGDDEDWNETGITAEASDDDEVELESEEEAEMSQRKPRKLLKRSSSALNGRKLPNDDSDADHVAPSQGNKLHASGTTNLPTMRTDKKSLSKDSVSRKRKISPEGKLNAKQRLGNLLVQSVESIRDGQSESCNDISKDKIVGHGVDLCLTGEAAERFGHRDEEKFTFLGKNRRDAAQRRPCDPNYDSRTLHLPDEFLKGLSGGQRQWWEFKSKHMDKVLFFKMGKFYEMFEMDAHIGAQELDLHYMKGEQPHCGFPEKNFAENAERLAQKGYRVLVIEQTETPDQLEQRNKETGSKDKVVSREICAVITKGTMVEGNVLAMSSDAAYLLAVSEICNEDELGVSVLGVCAVDTSTGRFILGQFLDDSARTHLRSVLTELRPAEIIKPHGMLMEATEKALKDQTRNALITNLTPDLEFWNSTKTIEELIQLYSLLRSSENGGAHPMIACESKDKLHVLPELLHCIASDASKREAVLCALGGCISYLRQVLLDHNVLSIGWFEILPGSDPLPEKFPSCVSYRNEELRDRGYSESFHFSANSLDAQIIIDVATLENLEILENSSNGGSSGTLLSLLDHCVTGSGRRLLRRWIVRPLMRAELILERQIAIKDLKGVAADAAKLFRRDLAKLPDLERLLARLHASSKESGRNAQRVVFYEDAAKKQLKEFIAALHGFQTIAQVLLSFKSNLTRFNSAQLQQLLTPGQGMPNLTTLLEHFEDAFDWFNAEKTGRIVPRQGVDESYDSASEAVINAEGKLELYLKAQRQYFGNCSEITYVTVGKERFLMEIPVHLQGRVPSEFDLRSSRKGFQRYWTSEIKEFMQELVTSQEKKELALKGILQGLVKRFCENYTQWLSAVHAVAELDALISLSVASECITGTVCTPIINYNLNSSGDTPRSLIARGLRHPILEGSLFGGGAFVPNDVVLGGSQNAPFMLLTGPNMGGKSTLIRQVCLAVILAQIGADVPAESLALFPVDRIFVRMGAKDHIFAGQSTFLVELSETASMLSSATKDSLVALDELGRGTATSDGQAIAHAVLHHLSHKVGCRGIFSTHYHRLADEHADDPAVALYHMACNVGTGAGGLQEVTFLYKLALGACPKSYGVNVARIAGMPDIVLQRAATRSSEMEAVYSRLTVNAQGNILENSKLLQEILHALNDLFSSHYPMSAELKCLHQLWEKAGKNSMPDVCCITVH